MTVVVTGGSRGIGGAIVEKFAAAGWDVAFTYVSREDAARDRVKEVQQSFPQRKVRAYRLDLADHGAIDSFAEAVIEDFENVDALVNNAATVDDGPAVTMSDESWNEVLNINLSGPFYLTRAFLMHFLSNRFGRVVFISSLAQYGSSGQVNYAAAKAGLSGVSLTLAKEYGRKGITSNVVTVGLVPTEMSGEGVPASSLEFWNRHCPAGRVGTGEEVASAVLYLCRPEAGFVNGENVRVSGGLTYAP
ncbi:MAG: SDR family NAD(P)-dependent oxidoreductase [Spirochaetota bacterium]